MKEMAKRIFRNFDLGTFLTVVLMLTGGVLMVVSIAASLIHMSWKPMWIMVPAILSLAAAAGMS